MIAEFSLEFNSPRLCPEVTKRCGGSIERKNVYVAYTTLSLSVVIVLVIESVRLNAAVGVVW